MTQSNDRINDRRRGTAFFHPPPNRALPAFVLERIRYTPAGYPTENNRCGAVECGFREIPMYNPFSSFCDDFYVNMRLSTQLQLPHERDTVLHFFERIQKEFPTL